MKRLSSNNECEGTCVKLRLGVTITRRKGSTSTNNRKLEILFVFGMAVYHNRFASNDPGIGLKVSWALEPGDCA
jgi:hypothetical protein